MSRVLNLLFRTAICTVLAFVTLGPATTVAQVNGNIEISSVDAARIGLEVEWTSQVSVSSEAGKIVDMYLDINEDRAQTFFEIRYGGKREFISVLDNSAFGVPYGANPAISRMQASLKLQVELLLTQGVKPGQIRDETGVDLGTVAHVQKEMLDRVTEAEEAAKLRQTVLQALMESQNRNIEVTMKKITLPRSTIYVVNSTGTAQAIDADTGTTRWTTSVGNPDHPTLGIGASHDHVAVINGSKVYCLSAENGKQLWEKRCRTAVGASPAVSEDFVFVPLINGRLEAFPIETGVGSESFVSIGNANSRPTVTTDSICWPTSEGNFTVASNREVSSPRFRLKSGSSFHAPGTQRNGILFIGAADGFAYAIDEVRGSLKWEFSSGQTFKQSLIPLGQYVYLVTEEKQMYKLYAETGFNAPGWSKPIKDVKNYVGASKSKIYVQNSGGQIVALSQESGQKLGTLISDSTTMVLPNFQSDRLYVANQYGRIQCLREASPMSSVPFFHADEQGSGTRGSDTRGSDTRGSDTRGSDTRGSDNRGSDTRSGSDTRGSDTR